MEQPDSRHALLALIERYPGLHVRELARQSGMSEALALYHLQQLVESKLVESVEDANYRRFYPKKAGTPVNDDRLLMSWLRRRVPLQIALLVLARGSASHQELTQQLGLAKSTVSYHLSSMEKAGLVRRDPKTEAVSLTAPERVTALLVRWNPPDDVVSRFGRLWDQFYARRRK